MKIKLHRLDDSGMKCSGEADDRAGKRWQAETAGEDRPERDNQAE